MIVDTNFASDSSVINLTVMVLFNELVLDSSASAAANTENYQTNAQQEEAKTDKYK